MILLYALYNSVFPVRWMAVDVSMCFMATYKLCVWFRFGRVGSVLISGFLVLGGGWILAKRELLVAERELVRARSVTFADPPAEREAEHLAVRSAGTQQVRATAGNRRKCRIPYVPR